MATPKYANRKPWKDPGYKGPWVREFKKAKDGFFFVANGKAWMVMADYDLAKLSEGKDTVVSSFVSLVAEYGMGADLKEGCLSYTHDMHGISYKLCRLPDGLVAHLEKVEVGHLEKLLEEAA